MPALRPGDPTQLGDWTLTRRIAEGGAGNIFQGVRGIDDSENAAIKVLKDEAFDVVETQEYLKREVAALKLVDHKNVAKLIEANFESSGMWLATEYVYGPNLETFLKQNPDGINELRWFQIAENLLSGLVAIHSHKIIHRDIKPSNVMLSEQTREVKIIDFGISYVPTFTTFSTRDQFEGSRLFAAPENISLKDDPKMDVFSAAVTLAYIGRGSSIWKTDTPSQLTESIIKGTPNLEGLSQIQQEFLVPLLAKLPSERSSSEEAHKNCLDYLQFLVGEGRQPRRNISFKYKKRLLGGKSKFFAPLVLFLAGVVGSGLYLQSSNNQQNSTTKTVVKDHPSTGSGAKSRTRPELATPVPNPSVPSVNPTSSPVTPEITKWLNEAEAAYNKNDLVTALQLSLLAANKGNAQGAYRAGFILEKQGRKAEAIKWLKISAKNGYLDAFNSLGLIYSKEKKIDVAKSWWQKGTDVGNTASMWNLALQLEDEKNTVAAKALYLKAALLGHVNSMFNLALIYDNSGDLKNAIKWYAKSADGGLAVGALNAAVLYEESADWVDAKKYYEIGATKGNSEAMYGLAYHFQHHLNDLTSACTWYTKSAALGNSKSINAEKNFCSTSTQQSPSIASSSASENNAVQAPSSNPIRFSYPTAPNVVISSVYGRPFRDTTSGSSGYWYIPVNNPGAENAVDFNSLQVRESGATDQAWTSIPYTLKISMVGNTTEIDALVSQLFLDFGWKANFCPEFRLAKEESNRVTKIWTKTGIVDCIKTASP
jgi:serine/threonine protein kinase